MSYTTQCPSCQTRFKVNDQQLSAAKGLVRCGRCAHVFNATEHFVSAEAPAAPSSPVPPAVQPPPPAPPSPPPAAADPMDDFELELPDFDPQTAASEPPGDSFSLDSTTPDVTSSAATPDTSREAEEFQRALAEALSARTSTPPAPASYATALEADEEAPALPEVFGKQRRTAEVAARVEAAAAEQTAEAAPARPQALATEETTAPEPQEEASEPQAKTHKPLLTVIMALLAIIGSVLLAGQLVYFNRTRIAAEVPESRPALEAFCSIVGCKVPWPSDIGQVRTEWSELAFVPEHANLIQLSATLKNHAAFAQNYPMLEVSLKDADDQVLIRKVFSPKEYLKADDFKLQRFNANSEVKITMRLDIGKVRAMGYSLYWFYP
ncbi:probable transmembrane protein [Aquitalea magnusonii]|uniref:Probable transmembrane protein n=1 Tax=Aquitalea magnusonii TaxID=332411 RepID=A0A3G9GE09_9NEIS|nr:probable transmembrane protein [Aquitalea magnusonii]